MTPRQMTYRFLALPYPEKLAVAEKLGLLHAGETFKSGLALATAVMPRMGSNMAAFQSAVLASPSYVASGTAKGGSPVHVSQKSPQRTRPRPWNSTTGKK